MATRSHSRPSLNGKHRRRPHHHAYPRPQLVRENWTNLNGPWDFAIDVNADFKQPDAVDFNRSILIPFSPETPASGIHDTSFYHAVWYRRAISIEKPTSGDRVILHFGAVDWHAQVWVNNHLAIEHDGGYTPFHADITDLLTNSKEQTIIVRAHDDPHDLAKPRGKQDWVEHAHSIWYWRTTGIWQTVWLETVAANHIARLKWIPNVERWEIRLAAEITTQLRDDLRLHLRLVHKNRTIVDDTYNVPSSGELDRRIGLPDPGIDDYRSDLLWSPSHPNLIRAQLQLTDSRNKIIDAVQSYTAMRSVAVQGDRFLLNTRPYHLRLVLDQGYWPDTGLTAPDDDALQKDVELAKSMGFNGVRKHQKIEDPRYLYWADVLGLLVWEEMPSPYTFADRAIHRLTSTWMEAIARDISHPCIIAWVPFNESWGVPDLPDVPAQRAFVKAAYHLTKSLDPTRPVIGNDGWESLATDIIAIHDYDADPARIAQRYSSPHESFASAFKERPGHRIVILDEESHRGLPIMLTEFGGIAFSKEKSSWGYSRAKSADDFAARYACLLEAVRNLPLLSGFCYTQFTNTYQEANGLLHMDRTPKFPLSQIAIATRGPESDEERRILAKWRQRLINIQRQHERAVQAHAHAHNVQMEQ